MTIAATSRCGSCNAPRNGAVCWKCGAPTFEPHAGWTAPELPPINVIREVAREVGYAIGVHGSLERDLDLIAAPWTEGAVGNADLVEHLCAGLSRRLGLEVQVVNSTLARKPLGRYACTIQIDGWFKCIDLSIAPRGAQDA